jgi:hypothetical protein
MTHFTGTMVRVEREVRKSKFLERKSTEWTCRIFMKRDIHLLRKKIQVQYAFSTIISK